MKKLTATALFALACIAIAPASFAQTAAPAPMLADHSMSTQQLIGAPVYNDQGDKIGAIVDILVKDAAAEPTAVLSVGDYVGGGTKLVAAPLSQVKLQAGKAMMHDASKQKLASMPTFLFPAAVGGAG